MQLISKIQQGQSFLDKVIQLTGSVENAFNVAVFNNMSITDNREIGDEIRAEKITNKQVAKFFKHKQPSTDLTEETQIDEQHEGIGYWAIGVDFVVS